MKKIAVVACNSHLMERLRLAGEALSQDGNEVQIFCGDFNHTRKEYDTSEVDIEYIHTQSYKKNLSISRLLSHKNFAKSILRKLREYKADYVYAQVPPNSLVKQCARYKKESGCKLVFDLIDMWPESMPVGRVKKIIAWLFLRYWKNLRNKSLRHADLLITECDLYQSILARQRVKLPKAQTIYLCKKPFDSMPCAELSDTQVDVCYLGAINNIIDIPKIIGLLSAINLRKKVAVHIIGDGENRQAFIEQLESSGIQTIYYGAIYDETKKLELFSKCHFGLNIMRDSVTVGLTIKSLDYFSAGLPVLSNIKEDTHNLVEKYNCGINISNDFEHCAQIISELNVDDYLKLRENTLKMFEQNFALEVISTKLNELLT